MEDERDRRDGDEDRPISRYDPRRKFDPNEIVVLEDDGYEE